MITNNNIERLVKLVRKYARADYLRANPPERRRMRKDGTMTYTPYTLSPRTNEAREMLILARKENPTESEENAVKAYLLRMKMAGEEDNI